MVLTLVRLLIKKTIKTNKNHYTNGNNAKTDPHYPSKFAINAILRFPILQKHFTYIITFSKTIPFSISRLYCRTWNNMASR